MNRPGRFRGFSAALASVAALAAPAFAQTPGNVVKTEHVRAELVAHAPEGVAAGKALRLGLKLRHAPKWHTYWKNAGDSGLPTQFAWTLPAGVTASEIRWPVPEAIPVGPLVNYGYEGEILLAVDTSIPAGFAASSLDVRLKADWLVCREICIPETGEFRLRVPAQAATVGHASDFAAADARQPKPAPNAKATGTVEADGAAISVVADGLPAAARGRTLQFFAETPGVVEHAAPVKQGWQGERWTVRVPLSPQRSESPAPMPALLVDPQTRTGWSVQVAVTGWPAGAQAPAMAVGTAPPSAGGGADPIAATPSPAPATSPVTTADSSGGPSLSLLAALGLALVGGLLLNLMPCVFPILSLKLLSFADSHADRAARTAGGIAYTAGVVVAFVALGGVLLALRAGGEQLGWGFQLQSPVVVAALAVLFTLIGLNLAGVYEIGRVLPSSVAGKQLKHPLADDVLTGVLAVAIASPCTAPFMGAATGATLAMPPSQALAVFAAIGLGMALPYLVASVVPQAARLLPRPGPWLARFRTAMAFPMFATVVWLVWVLGKQAGIDGAAVLLALLVAIGFAAWTLGTPGLRRRSRLVLGAFAVAIVGTTLANGWPALVYPDPGSTLPSREAAASPSGRWHAWSPQALADATRDGRSVFVDFTAAWCITCQVNKRTTLADADLLADFRARDVVLMRADWTLRDARITAELARLGRTGVPVYAIYPADGSPPRLLPEVITPGAVREAIAALPMPPAAAPRASTEPTTESLATRLSALPTLTRSSP